MTTWFWSWYFVVGYATMFGSLAYGVLSGHVKHQLRNGVMTPWDMLSTLLILVPLWPVYWLVFWWASDGDDGPWL